MQEEEKARCKLRETEIERDTQTKMREAERNPRPHTTNERKEKKNNNEPTQRKEKKKYDCCCVKGRIQQQYKRKQNSKKSYFLQHGPPPVPSSISPDLLLLHHHSPQLPSTPPIQQQEREQTRQRQETAAQRPTMVEPARLLVGCGGEEAKAEGVRWQRPSRMLLLDVDPAAGTVVAETASAAFTANAMWVAGRNGTWYATEAGGVLAEDGNGAAAAAGRDVRPGARRFALPEAGGFAPPKTGDSSPDGEYPLLPTGDGPCHIAVSPEGTTVAVAEYDAGAVSVFATASAMPTPPARVRASLRGEGCTPGEGRQDAAHPHSTLFLSEDAFVVCDLGADTVEVFKRGVSGEWTAACVFDILAEVGAAQGARHCAASACGRRLYVVCELSNAVLVLALSEGHTSLALVGTLSTLTEESVHRPGAKPFPFYTAASHAAGVALCHDSNSLYVTNRGADYVAVFELDARTGLPVPDGGGGAGGEVYPTATIPTGGRLPWELSVRHDAATGRSLVAVANQFGETVTDDGCVTVSSYSHKDKTATLVSKHPAKLAMFCAFV